MKLPVLRDALDGRDLAAFELHGEQRAALRRLAVDEDGTRSALTRVAADVRPGQPDDVAQEMYEEEPWLHFAGEIDPVDVDADATHGASLPDRSPRRRETAPRDRDRVAKGGSGGQHRERNQEPPTGTQEAPVPGRFDKRVFTTGTV